MAFAMTQALILIKLLMMLGASMFHHTLVASDVDHHWFSFGFIDQFLDIFLAHVGVALVLKLDCVVGVFNHVD